MNSTLLFVCVLAVMEMQLENMDEFAPCWSKWNEVCIARSGPWQNWFGHCPRDAWCGLAEEEQNEEFCQDAIYESYGSEVSQLFFPYVGEEHLIADVYHETGDDSLVVYPTEEEEKGRDFDSTENDSSDGGSFPFPPEPSSLSSSTTFPSSTSYRSTAASSPRSSPSQRIPPPPPTWLLYQTSLPSTTTATPPEFDSFRFGDDEDDDDQGEGDLVRSHNKDPGIADSSEFAAFPIDDEQLVEGVAERSLKVRPVDPVVNPGSFGEDQSEEGGGGGSRHQELLVSESNYSPNAHDTNLFGESREEGGGESDAFQVGDCTLIFLIIHLLILFFRG